MSQLQLVKDAISQRPVVTALLLGFTVSLVISAARKALRTRRTKSIPKTAERVFIVGASSGIGRTLALDYAARGAWVCVVARRSHLVEKVAEECRAIQDLRFSNVKEEKRVLFAAGDCAVAEDMVRVRTLIEKEWKGFDTLILTAGVSALKPLYEVAGLSRHGEGYEPAQATPENIQYTAEVAQKAINANYIGPVVVAVTFFPLLEQTSKSPSVLLLSSVAAVVPAPTRSIYCSTKAAALQLYLSLAIEHSKIQFSAYLPATVEGDFRASAVDKGHVREDDPSKGLKLHQVSESCINAVDNGARFVFQPYMFGVAHLLYWIYQKPVEYLASRKYHFPN